MSLMSRIRQSIYRHRYKLTSTERLIYQIGAANDAGIINPLLEALKERLAHQDGSLHAVDWSSAKMNSAMLSACSLQEARFTGADLRGAYFGYSNLHSASFEGADLQETSLREANLRAAAFDRANLRGANLARADLQGSSCVASDMTGANLWGADLRGTDLTDTVMTNCILVDVAVNETTTLPDGSAGDDRVDWNTFTRNK